MIVSKQIHNEALQLQKQCKEFLPRTEGKICICYHFPFYFHLSKKNQTQTNSQKIPEHATKKRTFYFFFFKMQAPGTQNSSDLLCHTASFLHFIEVKPTIYSIPQNYNALK